MNTTINYHQQAIDFLNKCGIKYSAKFLEYGYHFGDDKEPRNIYRLTLLREGKRISFRFGQSINGTNAGEIPTAYDLLASIQKYEVGSFENFCTDFGYDTDSRKAEKVYKEVVKEWNKVNGFFTGHELEELQEIN